MCSVFSVVNMSLLILVGRSPMDNAGQLPGVAFNLQIP